MSSGITALCRCPRLACGHAVRAATRPISSHPRLRTTARPDQHASRRTYATMDVRKDDQLLKEMVDTKGARNGRFAMAYKVPPEENIKKELKDPFVHNSRQYPSEAMTHESREACWSEAKRMAGHREVWEYNTHRNHFLVKTLEFDHIHQLLKRTTPRSKRDEIAQVLAVRIIVPGRLSLHTDALGTRLGFVDEVSGILERVRVDPDADSESIERKSFIIRGRRNVVVPAVEQLASLYPDIDIFELGDVATTDYHTQRLWPPEPQEEEEGQTPVSMSSRDHIWLHPEPEEKWIEKRFSDIPKPDKGNAQAFESYITELVSSRIPRNLVQSLYREELESKRGPKTIDTEAERVRLILEVFEDPENRKVITNNSLKMIMNHMAGHDGYRKKARHCMIKAEEWGLPMDTEHYNIILEGSISSGDFRGFYKLLSKMKHREFEPNARTWLLFLKLVKKDDARRQVVASMFERNILSHQSVRRGVAAVTSSMDAYAAFRSGRSLKDFIREHNERFGGNWYTREAMIGIITEYFRYNAHRPISAVEWSFLVEQRFENGEQMDNESMNAIVTLCAKNKDWVGTIWCIDHMTTKNIRLDDKTYMALLRLSCQTANWYAFTATLVHGVHNSTLRYGARQLLKAVVLPAREGEEKPWKDAHVSLFTKMMAEKMALTNRESQAGVDTQIIDLYKEFEDALGLVPAEPLAMSLLTALSLQHQAATPTEEVPAQRPVLEIPMKKRGESDDNVTTTFKFDTTLNLIQAKDKALQPLAQSGEDSVTEPGEYEAAEDGAPAFPGLDSYNWEKPYEENLSDEDVTPLVDDPSTTQSTPKTAQQSAKPDFTNSPFQTAATLSTTIARAAAKTQRQNHLRKWAAHHDADLRLISEEEDTILATIRARAPKGLSEAQRIAEDTLVDANGAETRFNTPSDLTKPWLRDGFEQKSPQEQDAETAEWIRARYVEVKSYDTRNLGYSSRQRMLERARAELEGWDRGEGDVPVEGTKEAILAKKIVE